MDDLTELVLYFNEGRKNNSINSSKLRAIYNEIKRHVALTIYYYPVKCKKLTIDDASNFLVSMQSRIKPLIFGFQGKCNFDAYLKQTIRYGLLSFRQKNRQDNVSSKILEMYCEKNFEIVENPIEIQDKVINEEPIVLTIPQLRFKIILSHSICSQRRFTVFFLTLSPLLDVGRIDRICFLTGMNFCEIMKLTNLIQNQLVELLKHREKIKSMRNYYWYRICYLETEIEELTNSESDKIKKQKYKNIINSCKYHQEKRTKEIEKIKHVPYNIISDVLSIPRGTISSNTYMARKALNFCNKEITKRLFNYNELYEIENQNKKIDIEQKLTTFHFSPFKVIDYNPKFQNMAAETTKPYL